MTAWCRAYDELCAVWDEHGIPGDASTRDVALRLLLPLWRAHRDLRATLDEVLAATR